ncbi:MAG: MASE1 domain-containing protein [Methanomicrobiales archaeon]|nr:MASE1 domain-containing protein [Methanomicrobiales archaeon]
METVQGEVRQKPGWWYPAIFIGLVIANTLLAAFGEISTEVAPGVSAFYIAVAFMIAFALWFGGWGVLAAYLGCVLGAGVVGGVPPVVNLYWSLADVWQVLIPLAAFRAFHADTGLSTWRDLGVFLAFGWLLNNLAGAAWGSATLALGGVIPWEGVQATFTNWFIGNLIVTIIITPPLLVYLTPRLRKAGLLVKGTWA